MQQNYYIAYLPCVQPRGLSSRERLQGVCLPDSQGYSIDDRPAQHFYFTVKCTGSGIR